MSYDVYLMADVCEKCGQRGPMPSNLPDPTYNLTPIFDLAITGEGLPNPEVSEMGVVLFGEQTDRPRGLRILNGRKATDTVRVLTNALARLNDPNLRAQFVALEPENKWGTVDGAIMVIGRLKEAAEEYPACTWEVR